jgi:hypothetical protein
MGDHWREATNPGLAGMWQENDFLQKEPTGLLGNVSYSTWGKSEIFIFWICFLLL